MKLECDLPSVENNFEVFWYLNNNTITKKIENTREIRLDPNGNLLFLSINNEHGSRTQNNNFFYRCEYYSQKQNITVQGSKIFINIVESNESTNYPPLLLYASPNIQTFKTGESSSIFCTYGGYPIPTITWILNHTQIPNTEELLQFPDVVENKNMSKRHAAQIDCKASNGFGSDGEISFEIKTEPLSILKIDSKTVNAGEEFIEMQCSVKGPRPKVLEMFYNAKSVFELEFNERWRVNHDKVSITNVQLSDIGVFGCRATFEKNLIYREGILMVN